MSGRHRKPHNRAPGRHRRPPGPSRFIAPGLVAVALLGAGGVGAHAALSGSSSDSTMPPILPAVGSLSPGAVPGVSSTPTLTPTASTPSPARAPHHASYALKMVIIGSVSWIEVKRPSGRVLVSGLVRHGHHLTYRHGPLDVVIGNAGAVTVTRGTHTRQAGKPGEVVNLRVE
jgi:hypothetical protein